MISIAILTIQYCNAMFQYLKRRWRTSYEGKILEFVPVQPTSTKII
jgi:hypothetical protein